MENRQVLHLNAIYVDDQLSATTSKAQQPDEIGDDRSVLWTDIENAVDNSKERG